MKPLLFKNKHPHKLSQVVHQQKRLKLRPSLTKLNDPSKKTTTDISTQSKHNQIRCLSQERDKHKKQKILSRSDKSEMLENICSLEEQFDELVQQHQNSRKSNTSNRTNHSYSRAYSQKLISSLHQVRRNCEEQCNNWRSGNKEQKGHKEEEETYRSGKRSIVIMNKYAPKSTINLLQKNPQKKRSPNISTSIVYDSSSKQALGRKKQSISDHDSLQVIAIGLSSSKKQNSRDYSSKINKSYKLRLKKGINVVSAHNFGIKEPITSTKNTYR